MFFWTLVYLSGYFQILLNVIILAISLKKLLSIKRSHNDAYVKPLQVFSAFQQFTLHHFDKTPALVHVCFFLTENKTKEDFHSYEKRHLFCSKPW